MAAKDLFEIKLLLDCVEEECNVLLLQCCNVQCPVHDPLKDTVLGEQTNEAAEFGAVPQVLVQLVFGRDVRETRHLRDKISSDLLLLRRIIKPAQTYNLK